MSDGSDMPPVVDPDHSRTQVIQTCDENGSCEDEQSIEVMETTPVPPVGLFTALSSVVDESELLELTVSTLDTCPGMTYFPVILLVLRLFGLLSATVSSNCYFSLLIYCIYCLHEAST